MEQQKRVLCPENEEVVKYMIQKRQEMAEKPKGLSDNVDMTLSKAFNNICNANNPIKSLKDLSQIKGVGKWILKLMQGFFETGSSNSEPGDLLNKGKKTKGAKRYVPQRSSVAYALLITLYRGTANGNEFMRKQELIDAAEVSGLSRVPIVPEKGKGKPGQFGSSPRDWYSGWSCMTTLITKGLVVKSSCPAKYMLTLEGQEAARECLMRSGLVDPVENLANDGVSDLDTCNVPDLEFPLFDSAREVALPSVGLSGQRKSIDVPLESLERFTRMGYSKEQVLHACNEVSETSQNKEVSSLWPAVLCHLREDQVYGLQSESHSLRENCHVSSTTNRFTNALCKHAGQVNIVGSQSNRMDSACDSGRLPNFSAGFAPNLFTSRACSSSDYPVQKSSSDDFEANTNILSVPPLGFGETFEDAYKVILLLDDREQFATKGSRSRKIIDNISAEFKIQIEVKRLPVGDGIWIARHRCLHSEYVLDFIVERKNVDDLRCSIRDNRYKDQKLRLLRCGLKKLIYLVEGDPNSSEAAESIKTACFTTEILEGFDVQRTSGLADTLRKYGYLTHAITQYYKSRVFEEQPKGTGICPPFREFIRRCQDLDRLTVGDVFAIQLMQVPQVTEDIAIAVLDLYPTLLSLAHAYSLLEGDVCAQEEMLRKQSNNVISAVASKHIFQLVWSN